MGKKMLEPKEVTKRLNAHKDFIYKQPQLAVPCYFDICYEYIMEHCIDTTETEKKIRDIGRIVRKNSYEIKRDDKNDEDRTNRGEEWFVLDLFNRNTDKKRIFGELIGYQIPIKNSNADKGAGKIDFISIIDNYLYLHEIKADYSKESILKAILEVQTYYQQINHQKLISDFSLEGKVNKEIKKSVVIFEKSEAYKQKDIPRVKSLLKLFKIELFVLSNSNVFTRKQ
jgi:hypothetical protein